jgi:hypothetical protein
MKSSHGSTRLWLRARLRRAHKGAAMSRTTKALSGPAKDKVLRALVAGTDAVPADVAARVGEVLARSLSEVRVRRDAWDATRGLTADVATAAPIAETVAKKAGKKPSPAPSATTPAAPAASPAAPTPAAPAVAPAANAFDPYAFSAVSILTKKGKAALAAAFDTIGNVEDLHKVAVAQHLAIDPALTDVNVIRATLVAATERRIAERKAAAS